MMTTTGFILLLLMLISNAALLAVACFVMYQFERRWRSIEQYWDAEVASAPDSIDEVPVDRHSQATEQLARRLGELQGKLQELETKAPQQSASAERAVPIDNAIRMAKLGATADDLTRNCGLNHGEAHLLQKLHGQAANVATTR